MTTSAYGNLIRVDTANGVVEEMLERVPPYANVSGGGVSEDTPQYLLFRFPQALPIAAIDATYADAVPVCRELSTPAGYLDALYVNRLGRLTLAEFKLWRNPRARREVIGQILDYAKDFTSWGYEDLQQWTNAAGQPRIGFRRRGSLAFLAGNQDSVGTQDSEDFNAAVSWMRQCLDRLVSTLNPSTVAR